MQVAIIEKTGDSKVIKFKEIDDPSKFKKDDVLIKQTAIGINFFDICFRRGQYKINEMPAIIGAEACGIVEAVGSNVKEFKVGDRVAYCTGAIGSYCEKRVIDKRFLIYIPQDISDTIAVASLKKGMMAHTLLNRVFRAKLVKSILVHSAAGGVGQFLCQFAKSMGIDVIGTVGSSNKVDSALRNGCRAVIDRSKDENFSKELSKLTDGVGVGVVYDGIGKSTIVNSLSCLWPMGLCVSYGESSGAADNLNLNYLVANSLFITRPTLALYKSSRVELVVGASEVFDGISKGILKPTYTEYAFKDIAQAHKDLESGKTIGSLVVKI